MRRSIQRNLLVSTGILTLTITTHLQTMRVFFPSVAWYLKDTIGVASTTLALYVLIVMAVGFFAAGLKIILGQRTALFLTGFVIALMRVLEQFVISPSADLWISIIGCGSFALFFPIFVAHLRTKGAQIGGPILAYGLFLGLALDSTIHGFGHTLDLSWIPGPLPILTTLIQSLGIMTLLSFEFYPSQDVPTDTHWRENLAFIALGPFLLLQVIILQNQGWISEISGITGEWGFVFVLAGNLCAVAGVFWGYKNQHLFQPTFSIAVGFLIPALVFLLMQPGWIFLLTLLVIQLLFGWSWAYMGNLTLRACRKGLLRTTILTTLGLLLFILLAFMYYAALDLPLPIYREAILPISAVLFGLTFLGLSLQAPKATTMSHVIHEPLIFSGSLLLLSLFYLVFTPPPPDPEPPSGKAVKIMTYNIHSAYNVEGRQDPEAIAKVIIESEADIVAIQEISRGWLVNGSTDLTAWLSHRLGMQVIFKGTTGPMWGNAILSKYPILQMNFGKLPSLGIPLERGYLQAKIDLGYQAPINIFATHLHHVESEPIIRYAQLVELLRKWGKRPQSIILGDLNTRPEEDEIQLLFDAGLVDSWSVAGSGAGNTYSSDDPFKRIDWIWHTPDMISQDAKVLRSNASDHLPVIVTILPQDE